MPFSTWWPVASLVLHITCQLVLAARVVMRRQPLGNTHAWLLLVLFVPVAGMVLYLLIGELRLGSRRVKKLEEAERAIEPAAMRLWAHEERVWRDEAARFKHLADLGSTLCHTPALTGNDLTLHTDAAATLDAMIADIDRAEDHCHLLTYIFQPSGKPLELVDALARAAGRGVNVRVAVDGAGSRAFLRSGLPRKLREAGAEVTELLPVNPLRFLFSRIDLRNHRKMLVVDGRYAYCGSQNITDDSFKPSRKPGIGPWIDATVRMEGPAAQAMALVFAADWNADAKEPITGLEETLKPLPPIEACDQRETSAVQLLPSGPGRQPLAVQASFLTTMYMAKQELILTTPYFVPDPTVLAGISAAAMRGVDVTLVLPKLNNKWIVAAAGRASFSELLDAGVKIMAYRPGLLHAKTLTADRDIALIGSANLDQRSFWLNYEVTLAVYDTNFASQLRQLQREYIRQSDRITLKQWKSRPIWQHAADNLAQLFAPLL